MIGDMLNRIVPEVRGRGHTLIGLVGRGIQASRTPRMHERESARLGLSCNYVLIDFDQLDLPDTALGEVLMTARAVGFAGLNVTHPFKQAVIPLLDALAPEADAIGAVNTVAFAGKLASGYNTDSWGFSESFRNHAWCSAQSRRPVRRRGCRCGSRACTDGTGGGEPCDRRQ